MFFFLKKKFWVHVLWSLKTENLVLITFCNSSQSFFFFFSLCQRLQYAWSFKIYVNYWRKDDLSLSTMKDLQDGNKKIMAIRGENLSLNVTTDDKLSQKPWDLREFHWCPLTARGMSGSGLKHFLWSVHWIFTYFFLFWMRKSRHWKAYLKCTPFPMSNNMQQSALCCVAGCCSDCGPALDIIVGNIYTQNKGLISLKFSSLHVHKAFLQAFTKKQQLRFTSQTRWHDGGKEKQWLHISKWSFWNGNSHRCSAWVYYYWCLQPTVDKYTVVFETEISGNVDIKVCVGMLLI